MSQGIFLFNHNYELADTIETDKLTENYMDAVLNGLITGGFTTTEYKDFVKYDYFGVKEENNFWIFKIRSVVKDNDLIRVSGIHIMFDELQGVVIRDKRPQNRRANEVLNMILEDTDWKVGTVVVSASFSGNFYHQSTLSALYELASKSTCEFRPVVKFKDGKIISKEIQLYDRLSDDYGKLFTYGDNLLTVVAETNTDELFTAFIGRGKGEEIFDEKGVSTGGYGRKIKFDTIDYKNTKDGISVHSPVGQDYIEITQATKMYGYPNGKPRMTEVSFDNIEDRKELADATFDYALENCRPKVQLKASGLQYETVELGEVVTIIGKLDIRYKTRVFKIKKDFLREKIVSFEFGDKLIKSMSDRIKQGQITEKEREITEQNYIKAMIEMVESSYFNEDGYQYDLKAGNEYGLPAGIYSFNKPIDQNPTKVIYLGAGKLMIANSKKSDGSWNFSVAIDGDAVNANVIRAGLLKGGRVEWDLQNGTFLIGKDKEDFNFYWDGTTLKLRNVDLDLKNNYEFKQIKTDIDKSIAGVNTDLKTYVDDKDKLIDSKIDSVSQSLTVAEGELNSSISAVRTDTYKDINGVKTDLANNYDTKTQVDTKIKNADSSVRTYISKNYSSITQTDEKIQSQVGSVKTEINNNLSENYDTKTQVDAKIKSADTSVRSYVEKNYSTITQTDSKIASKVSSTKTEIMTDVNSSIGSVKSNLANNYDTKSQVDAKIKNADTSVRTYISKNYSTTTQTDSKIASKVASEIKVVNEIMESKDYSLRYHVSTNYSTKTQTSNLIESKISSFKTDISNNYYTKSQTDSRISQTASSIETKITSINGRLGNAESKITQTANEISTVVSNLDKQIENKVTEKAGSYEREIKDFKQGIENTIKIDKDAIYSRIGDMGDNLLVDVNQLKYVLYKTNTAKETDSERLIINSFGLPTYNIVYVTGVAPPGGAVPAYPRMLEIKFNTSYNPVIQPKGTNNITLAFEIKTDKYHELEINWNGKTIQHGKNTWKKYVFHGTYSQLINNGLFISKTSTSDFPVSCEIINLVIVEGTQSDPEWRSNDKSLYSEFVKSSKELSSNYSNLKNKTESNIRQTSELISTTVKKDGVISAINQSSESISISASKINLKGATIVDGTFETLENGKKVKISNGQITFSKNGITAATLTPYYDSSDAGGDLQFTISKDKYFSFRRHTSTQISVPLRIGGFVRDKDGIIVRSDKNTAATDEFYDVSTDRMFVHTALGIGNFRIRNFNGSEFIIENMRYDASFRFSTTKTIIKGTNPSSGRKYSFEISPQGIYFNNGARFEITTTGLEYHGDGTWLILQKDYLNVNGELIR